MAFTMADSLAWYFPTRVIAVIKLEMLVGQIEPLANVVSLTVRTMSENAESKITLWQGQAAINIR